METTAAILILAPILAPVLGTFGIDPVHFGVIMCINLAIGCATVSYTHLIVDLRSNPGGMLTSVCTMLDDILPKGLLVYTEDRNGKREDYNSTDDKSLDLPLAVLVNGYSASASEIFAGAIQDRKAGTIIGTTTYGKGVVQSILSLKDGSAFKITTSRYFTPSGTCIQGIGITPDEELEYEFTGPEDASYSVEYDNQIQKALEVLQQQK